MYVDMDPTKNVVPLGPPAVGAVDKSYGYSFAANFEDGRAHLKRCGYDPGTGPVPQFPSPGEEMCSERLHSQKVGYWYGIAVGVGTMMSIKAATMVFARRRPGA